MIDPLKPHYKTRGMQYNFDPIVLLPGESRTQKLASGCVFKLERLLVQAHMDAIRGHFRIRYSRLPLLDRENVIAYSNVTPSPSKRRTTVEYREHATGNFVRSYRPDNVIYVDTQASSYIVLKQLFVEENKMMPTGGPGITASMFDVGVLAGPLPVSPGLNLKLEWQNTADIPIELWVTVFGTAFWESKP